MLKRGEEINTEYEKGVVSTQFDHGGHDVVPVETETKETQGQFNRNVAIIL